MSLRSKASLGFALSIAAGIFVVWMTLNWAGSAQQGSALAFWGSLVAAFPAVRQMFANRPYSQAAQTTPTNEALRVIQVKVANQQVVNYVRFSWFDAIAYVIGAGLMALGFLLQVVTWRLPV